MNDLSDIWELAQTKFTDNKILTFNKEVSISDIYHESYFNNIWVSVDENLMTGGHICKLLHVHSCDKIAKQLIHTCLSDNSLKPIYNGELNKTSLRTALYRQAKNLGQNIKTGIHDDILYCMLNTENSFSVADSLKLLKVEGSFVNLEIPANLNVDKVRSLVFNYASRNNLKLSTRYINGVLRVKRLAGKTETTDTITGDFIKWLGTLPWDVPLPVPEIEGLSANSMSVTACRHYGGVFSFKDGVVIRNSFRLCKENGHIVFRVKGVVQVTFKASRRTQLTSEDWSRINNVLVMCGVTDEVLL